MRKQYSRYAGSRDSSQWWNQTRPQYTKPTRLHDLAVNRIARLLKAQNYIVTKEYEIDLRDGGEGYRGRKDIPFRVDIFAENLTRLVEDSVLIQVDGEYHRKGRHIGRTKNRDEAQSSYAVANGMRYITLTTEEANQLDDSAVYRKLKITTTTTDRPE